MIYFESSKKNTGMDFIDINIPTDISKLQDYYTLRRAIFCEEQQLFNVDDYDKKDALAIPIVALKHYLGAPDKVIGCVRIYEESERHWFGGRLGVLPEYRSFSKFICPNLFTNKEVSALYKMSIAAGLIYRAVSMANFLGCTSFSAHVQEQNVRLFERLHWNKRKEIDVYGVKHFLMKADLDYYPATPIYAESNLNAEFFKRIKIVA